jgi:hypothetical protein
MRELGLPLRDAASVVAPAPVDRADDIARDPHAGHCPMGSRY